MGVYYVAYIFMDSHSDSTVTVTHRPNRLLPILWGPFRQAAYTRPYEKTRSGE
jgi:hypothetical protein